jgi:predicted aldo/keto reductase-like oxidoreductase
MRYREFGKLGWKVSALGFGCMRLPTTDGTIIGPKVDEDQAIGIIRHAIDSGVNYVDTAYTYHLGKSESVVGEALKDGYRARVKLATKSPVWLIQKADDYDRFLDEQLQKLQTDYIDFYLLHGLDAKRWKVIQELGVLRRAEAAVENGRIGHIGFLFHDSYDPFKEIVDGYDRWEMCLMQHNYMDIENQAGTKGLRYAASKGLAVAIMEPLLGGSLASPPQEIKAMFDEYDPTRSPADWALQWLWSQPEVSCVLSGMRSMKQVDENLHSADESTARPMSEEELGLFDRVRQKFNERATIPCNQCGYCAPCPNGVDIQANLQLYNQGLMYDELLTPRFIYFNRLGEEERAGSCEQCGECEEKCPQEIPIGEWMPKVHAVLGEGKPYEKA